MAEPQIARIRPFIATDDKSVRFVIGKANYAQLADANSTVYKNPISIAIWLGLSTAFIDYMRWWPSLHASLGFLGFLRPLPAFAAVAVPLMFLVDWINRPHFETLTQKILHHPDMHDLGAYYAQNEASGLWILEYGSNFVGLIALDASRSETVPHRTAVIRHFYVDDPYRSAGVQDDLLRHAVNHAFTTNASLKRIQAPDSPLIPYTRASLRSAGFELDEHTDKVGFLRWKLGIRVLEREKWRAQQNAS